jgi:hypothetical protein
LFSSTIAEASSAQRSALRAVQSATEFDLVRVMDGKDPFASHPYSLFPVPDAGSGQLDVQVGVADNARLLLQSGDWYLVSGMGKIGWIHPVKS